MFVRIKYVQLTLFVIGSCNFLKQATTISLQLPFTLEGGYAVTDLVEAPRYKPESLELDSRWVTGVYYGFTSSGRPMAPGSTQSDGIQ